MTSEKPQSTQSEDSKERLLHGLNGLLHKLVDAREAYNFASEEAEDRNLHSLFTYSAEQRAEFCEDLARLIEKHGGTPENALSVTGVTHILWAAWKRYISDEDATTLIQECAQEERDAVREYDRFMEEFTLPDDVRDLLKHQRTRIHSEIEQLERYRFEYAGK